MTHESRRERERSRNGPPTPVARRSREVRFRGRRTARRDHLPSEVPYRHGLPRRRSRSIGARAAVDGSTDDTIWRIHRRRRRAQARRSRVAAALCSARSKNCGMTRQSYLATHASPGSAPAAIAQVATYADDGDRPSANYASIRTESRPPCAFRDAASAWPTVVVDGRSKPERVCGTPPGTARPAIMP